MLLQKNVDTNNVVESTETLMAIAHDIQALTIDKIAEPLHIAVMVCTQEEYNSILDKIRNGK